MKRASVDSVFWSFLAVEFDAASLAPRLSAFLFLPISPFFAYYESLRSTRRLRERRD